MRKAGTNKRHVIQIGCLVELDEKKEDDGAFQREGLML